MVGLNTSTRLRAIMALRRRLINSSLLPENMGPQITSIHPTLPVMISIRTVQDDTQEGGIPAKRRTNQKRKRTRTVSRPPPPHCDKLYPREPLCSALVPHCL